MDATTALLLAWVVARTGLAAPPPPRISLLNEGELQVKAYGRVVHGSPFRLLGVYDRDNQVIYLLDSFDKDNIIHRSYVVHELVHHVHNLNSVTARCKAELERDAYQVQFDWLAENGISDPYTATGIDPFILVLRTTCRDADDW